MASEWLYSECEDLFEREREAWQSTSMTTKLLATKQSGNKQSEERTMLGSAEDDASETAES